MGKNPNLSEIPNYTYFKGKVSNPYIFNSNLEYLTKYYWRVDSKNDRGITKGDVWSFTTCERFPILFAGVEWQVKHHQDTVAGPGYNYWSASENNVWIDSQGHLHLKITKAADGRWNCAEVNTTLYASYGIQRFFINSKYDEMDPNIVFSVFLYKDDEHEIDIEYSKWSNSAIFSHNTQYVIQDNTIISKDLKIYLEGTNIERFIANLNGPLTTHTIDWQQTEVKFQSIHGHYLTPPSKSYVFGSSSLRGLFNFIPKEQDKLRVHINLYLNKAKPPANITSFEVEITDVDLSLKPYWY